MEINPNPVIDQLRLTVLSPSNVKAGIEIFNEEGRTMMNTARKMNAGNNSCSFTDTQNYPPGIYYLRVTFDNNVIIRKFTKLK